MQECQDANWEKKIDARQQKLLQVLTCMLVPGLPTTITQTQVDLTMQRVFLDQYELP